MFLPPFRASRPDVPTTTESAIATAQQALDPSYGPSASEADLSGVLDLHNHATMSNSNTPTTQTPSTPLDMTTNPQAIQTQAKPLPQLHSFSPSVQEILRRHGQNPNISQDSPEYVAARKQVLESMAVAPSIVQQSPAMEKNPPAKRGRGRGRPPNSIRLRGTSRTVTATIPGGSISTPTRGRGRGGRPRGSGRGGKRVGGRKRKRRDSEEDTGSSSSSDEPSTPQAPTITKSGRSIQKPTAYTPLPSNASPITPRLPNSAPSMYGLPRRGRGGRKPGPTKNPQMALCAKCLRGHSPETNPVVFCDGCNTPWHQWCHYPRIPKEVLEIVDQAWFCSVCSAVKEQERVPMESRASASSWSEGERMMYLDSCGPDILRALLLRVLELHPDAPIFPPKDRTTMDADKNRTEGTATSSALTPLAGTPPRQKHEPYPDIALAAATNDPPSTYPPPGQGPVALQPTTRDGDVRWLVDDENGFGVFSHFYDGGEDRREQSDCGHVKAVDGLVSVAGTGEQGVNGGWIQKPG